MICKSFLLNYFIRDLLFKALWFMIIFSRPNRSLLEILIPNCGLSLFLDFFLLISIRSIELSLSFRLSIYRRDLFSIINFLYFIANISHILSISLWSLISWYFRLILLNNQFTWSDEISSMLFIISFNLLLFHFLQKMVIESIHNYLTY